MSQPAAESMPSQPVCVRPIIPLLGYQREDLESCARFRWNCWARQTGKSFTKSLRRILRGLDRRRHQIFLSAGLRQCRELMEKARMHCRALHIAAEFNASTWLNDMNVSAMEIRLPRGVRIIGLPANPDTARGFSGDVLLDEFAMHAQDRDIWAALFPTLLRGGGEVDVCSTPKGRGNVFYELAHNEAFSHSRVTLPQAVAQGLEVNVEEVRRAMGDDELFRQEFLCEFLDEATAFLTYAQIAACEDPACVPARRTADVARCCFAPESRTPALDVAMGDQALTRAGLRLPVDPSALITPRREGAAPALFACVDIGRKHDLTVMWMLARSAARGDAPATTDESNLRTVGLIELAHAPFADQFAVLSELLALPSLRRCCIDATGVGLALAEEALRTFGEHRVEPVTFTAATKSELAVNLRRLIEDRRIVIPADDSIRRDWHSLTREVTASGHLRLEAPRCGDGHADRFWAAALAVRAAGAPASRTEALPFRSTLFHRQGVW